MYYHVDMNTDRYYTNWNAGSLLMIHGKLVTIKTNEGDTIKFNDGTHILRADLERYLAAGSAECKTPA